MDSMRQAENDTMSAELAKSVNLPTDFLPSDPFEGIEGHWASQESSEYHNVKGFGFYKCKKCISLGWLSAYGNTNFPQACKKCKQNNHPLFIWVNPAGDRRQGRSEKLAGPHMAALCGACKAGVCDGGL